MDESLKALAVSLIKEVRLSEGLNPFKPISEDLVNSVVARINLQLQASGYLPEASLAPLE